MLESYMYPIQIIMISLLGFLFGLLLKEIFKINYYRAIFIMVIFVMLIIFLEQNLLNFYLNLNIKIITFTDYLANQLGGLILSLIYGEIWKKHFA